MTSARGSLSRECYVDAALAVIAEIGVDKLSMRNVGVKLNVSAMALYKYFPAKEDLLAAALDEFIARAQVIPVQQLSWDCWLEAVGRKMYLALCGEISWVPMLGALPLGGQADVVTSAVIEKLTAAGFSEVQASQAYIALIQMVIGAVCLNASLSRRANHDENVVGAAVNSEQLDIGLSLLITALHAELLTQ